MAPLSWMKVVWKTLQVTGFEVHLNYETMELPRERDMIIMVWIMNMCDDLDKLMAATRVRGFLNAIFLSDIVTADGKFIEEHALSEIEEYKRRSCYNFPREHPTKQDWVIWKCLLRGLLLENYELPTPMGKFTTYSHRIWEWTTNTEEKELF